MTRDRVAPLLAALATLLTAWSLSPVVDGKDWQGPCLAVVLTVMLVGMGLRRLGAPRALVAPGQLLAGGVVLTTIFAGESAVGGILPGHSAVVRLSQIVSDGGDTINRYSAPVPTSHGISLILAIGVLAIAVFVDLCVVGLRAPAAAGVGLLALYAVPAAVVPDGLPWRYFVAAATGWLLLLAHDASGRVMQWGRLLPRWGTAAPSKATFGTETGALAATGRRVGLAAVALAVVVPAALPGLSDGLITARSGSGAPGLNDLTVINPVLTLRDNLTPRQDVEVLRYQTTQEDLQPLRIVTADVFDGDTWKPGTRDVSRRNRASQGLPAPPGLSPEISQAQYTMRVEISSQLDQDFLPLPYPTRRVDIKGAWLYDAESLNVIGDDETARGKSYTATYLAVRPTVEQLRGAPTVPANTMQQYTRLPRSLPDVVRETALKVTEGTTTAYDQAMALQQWFREGGNFTYSTDAPSGAGGDAVAAFLRERSGFCVQFSSAMAVMARSLGIPARIGVGFLPGAAEDEHWHSVKLTDAHAWPELFFPTIGWVRFEPTPAARTGSAPTWAQVPGTGTPVLGGPSATATAGAGPTASASVDPRVQALQQAEERARSGAVDQITSAVPEPVSHRLRHTLEAIAVVVLLVAALLVTPVTARMGRRRRRRRARDEQSQVEAAWADLHEQVGDLGITLPRSLTPRQVDRTLLAHAELGEESRVALGRITTTVERSRYAPPSPTLAGSLPDDVRTVVRGVSSTRPRSSRWQARLYPASGTARLARVARRLGAVLGGWDERVARASHRIRAPRLRRR